MENQFPRLGYRNSLRSRTWLPDCYRLIRFNRIIVWWRTEMQLTLKRLLIVVTACAFLLAIYFGAASAFLNRLKITNSATQDIRTIDVSVWKQTINVNDLKPGGTATRRFRSHNSDSGFHVVATFADGTSMQQTDGYVTGGSITGERCNIIVSDDSISITQHF